MEVIGREKAKEALNKNLKSKKSELVAIIGRRRIGKTFLIKKYLENDILFKFSGLHNGNLHEHLERFTKEISVAMDVGLLVTARSWFDAFDLLRLLVNRTKKAKKKVIFLDEFPWMATNKSRFLTAFTDFWNSFAADRSDLLVIICGSSASWMINKVLRNKGGLHNRVTDRIFLEPFTLEETKKFLRYKNIVLSDYDIVKLYMSVGGVPFYLEQLEKGESIVQSIERICFAKGAILRMEYDELMASLFNNSKHHRAVIETLSQNPNGLIRRKLLDQSKLNSGGGATTILEELETSGFIVSYVPYSRVSKDKIYKLRDHYVIFYLRFIINTRPSANPIWDKLFSSPSYNTWTGLAFEGVCIEHMDKIQEALGISGVRSDASVWHFKGNQQFPGAQIDLLIDRADGVINLVEIKFYAGPYAVTADYANQVRQKITIFNEVTGNKKAIFPTFITTFGLLENIYSKELIQKELTIASLF